MRNRYEQVRTARWWPSGELELVRGYFRSQSKRSVLDHDGGGGDKRKGQI